MDTSESTRSVIDMPPLRLVGVCADREVQALAMCLIRRLVIQHGRGMHVLVRWLKFSHLNECSTINHPDDWITEADMFWYAGDSGGAVPGVVVELIGRWGRSQRSDGAFVVLLRVPFDRRRFSSPVETRLRQIAREIGCPLFLRRIVLERPRSDAAFQVDRRPNASKAARSNSANLYMAPAVSSRPGLINWP